MTDPDLFVPMVRPPEGVEDLIQRLLKRAEIRRSIPNRKSVQLGEPDRIADLLEEAAEALKNLLATQPKT